MLPSRRVAEAIEYGIDPEGPIRREAEIGTLN